ncbi:pilus assembly PilX family protein [Duganella caerulea]|uniref:pilus assembly PilX family protein n=1 Tax=Duganella caerulea TaxID=2885762 RepID=UPI004037AC07
MARRRQRGVAVLMCLMMLILVMLLGVSAAQMSLQGEKAARGERDREVALQAAEDALADAERDIQSGTAAVSACDVAPAWQRVDLSGAEDGGACTVGYGEHTGAEMLTAEGVLPFRKPRYLVERMACHQPGEDASAVSYCYRVTVIGFGARPGTEVVLQTVYSKPE